MAVTMSPYNHLAKLLLNQEVDFANIRIALLDATGLFVGAHVAKTNVDNAGAREVFGNGWVQGGPTLTNVAVTTVDTNDAMLDADDVSVTATGGAIGPAENALIYDATSLAPLIHVHFGRAHDAGQGTDFLISFNALGLLRGVFA